MVETLRGTLSASGGDSKCPGHLESPPLALRIPPTGTGAFILQTNLKNILGIRMSWSFQMTTKMYRRNGKMLCSRLLLGSDIHLRKSHGNWNFHILINPVHLFLPSAPSWILPFSPKHLSSTLWCAYHHHGGSYSRRKSIVVNHNIQLRTHIYYHKHCMYTNRGLV